MTLAWSGVWCRLWYRLRQKEREMDSGSASTQRQILIQKQAQAQRCLSGTAAPPRTFLRLNRGGLGLAVSVAFQKWRPDIHTRFVRQQWQLFLSLYMGAQQKYKCLPKETEKCAAHLKQVIKSHFLFISCSTLPSSEALTLLWYWLSKAQTLDTDRLRETGFSLGWVKLLKPVGGSCSDRERERGSDLLLI